jgi:hypothetical protein
VVDDPNEPFRISDNKINDPLDPIVSLKLDSKFFLDKENLPWVLSVIPQVGFNDSLDEVWELPLLVEFFSFFVEEFVIEFEVRSMTFLPVTFLIVALQAAVNPTPKEEGSLSPPGNKILSILKFPLLGTSLPSFSLGPRDVLDTILFYKGWSGSLYWRHYIILPALLSRFLYSPQ